MLGFLALLVVVLFAGTGVNGAGYALAGAILMLEVGQWGLARRALSRCPGLDVGARFASQPLDAAQERLVEFNLLATVLAPVLLARIVPTTSFRHEKLVVFVLLLVGMSPSGLSLWRVRRKHSWLAISRIPARPRRGSSKPVEHG